MPYDIDDLKKMEYELCEYLGMPVAMEKTYREWQEHFDIAYTEELTAEHETKMHEEYISYNDYRLS